MAPAMAEFLRKVAACSFAAGGFGVSEDIAAVVSPAKPLCVLKNSCLRGMCRSSMGKSRFEVSGTAALLAMTELMTSRVGGLAQV